MQRVAGVTVCRWRASFAEALVEIEAADVVIEAFACTLPENYVAAMARRAQPSLWINLEYLSAESWVADCHGLESPQGSTALQKYFFFPGFTANTGGLLCERDLLAQRQAFQADTGARDRFLATFGVQAAAGATVISVVCLRHCAAGRTARCTGSRPRADAVSGSGGPAAAGSRTVFRRYRACGRCTAHARRADYGGAAVPASGRLRSAAVELRSQLRARRGLVRARAMGGAAAAVADLSTAGRGALGQARSVSRFVSQRRCPLSERAPRLSAVWQAWNGRGDLGAAWRAPLQPLLPGLRVAAEDWAKQQGARTNLAAALVQFCADHV